MFVRSNISIASSEVLPVRPRGAKVNGGTIVYFVFPSQRGSARVYVDTPGTLTVDRDTVAAELGDSIPQSTVRILWLREALAVYETAEALIRRAEYIASMHKHNEILLRRALEDMKVLASPNLELLKYIAARETEILLQPGNYRELLRDIIQTIKEAHI